MNISTRLLLVAVISLFVQVSKAQLNIVGYINVAFQPGNTLFPTHLDDGSGNTLSTLFGSVTPEGIVEPHDSRI